jgi:hypothetical protein
LRLQTTAPADTGAAFCAWRTRQPAIPTLQAGAMLRQSFFSRVGSKIVTRTVPSTKTEAAASIALSNFPRIEGGAKAALPNSNLVAADRSTTTNSPEPREKHRRSSREKPSKRSHNSISTYGEYANTKQYFPKNGSIEERNSFLANSTRNSLIRFCGPVEGEFWASVLNLTAPTEATLPTRSQQPSPKSPAARNARGRNYSARSAKRKPS